jgi:uncharacterized protein with HEPN domain
MSSADPALLLSQMRRAANDAVTFAAAHTRESFVKDIQCQQAVLMNLVVIGEIAGRLARKYPGFAAGHPDLKWDQMRGLRNRIAHGYFEIDYAIVWETVQTDLPALLRALPQPE